MSPKVPTEGYLKKASQNIILITIFLLPLLFSTGAFYFFTTLKYAFIAFAGSLVFVFSGLYVAKHKFELKKEQKIILVLTSVFLAWLLLTSITGTNFISSFWSSFTRHTGFLTYLFAWIFFAATLFAFNKDNFYKPLKAFVFGGTLAAITVYMSRALFHIKWVFLENSNDAGTFGNTTYAGIFLAFSIFAAAILFFKEKNWRWLWAISGALMFLSPIFINIKNITSGAIAGLPSLVGEARIGLASIILGALLSLVFYFYFHTKKIYSNTAKGILVLMFLFIGFVLGGVVFSHTKLHDYIVNNGQGARLVYWDMAARALKDRPFLGYGLENFSYIHKRYFDPVLLSPTYPREPWTDKPHNNILEMAISAGFPGLVIYLSLIGYVLIVLIKKAEKSTPEDRVTAALMFGLLMSYLCQIFFAFDTVASLQAIFITIGLIFAFSLEGVKATREREMNKSLSGVLGGILTVVALLMIYNFSYKVERKSTLIRQMHQMDIDERLAVFENNMDISPVGRMENESQYLDIVLKNYASGWSNYPPEVRVKVKRNLDFLLNFSKKRSDQYPEDFRFALITAQISNTIYSMSKEKNPELIATSKKYEMRAIGDSPQSSLGYLALSETYMLEGKIDQALKAAQMTISLNPEAPEFYDVLVYLATLKRDPKLLEEKIKEAQRYIPNYQYKAKRYI